MSIFPYITISGSNASDALHGTIFNDVILGMDGQDTIYGSAGADELHGGGGFDTVDYSLSSGAVYVDLSQGLGWHGDADGDQYTEIEGVNGSAHDDSIIGGTDPAAYRYVLNGNDGNDILVAGKGTVETFLSGGSGNDDMTGNAGRNTFVIDSSGDKIHDHTVGDNDYAMITSITAYTLPAGEAVEELEVINTNPPVPVRLYGNEFNNTLVVHAGSNVLDGGGGSDVLMGNEQSLFVFSTALGPDNVDIISDAGSYKIGLAKEIFSGCEGSNSSKMGTLTANQFWQGPSAHDTDDRIIYNKSTGEFFYDPDGTGPAQQVHFATDHYKPDLTYKNFLVESGWMF